MEYMFCLRHGFGKEMKAKIGAGDSKSKKNVQKMEHVEMALDVLENPVFTVRRRDGARRPGYRSYMGSYMKQSD